MSHRAGGGGRPLTQLGQTGAHNAQQGKQAVPLGSALGAASFRVARGWLGSCEAAARSRRQRERAPVPAQSAGRMASPRGQLQQLSPCRRLSACKISSSPKKRHRGELSPTPAKLAGMQSAAGVAEEEAAPLKSTRRIAINGLPPRSPLPTATPLKADGNDSAFVSPPFTDLSSMATPGSLNSSSSSVDATAFSFPDLSPSPHPMSNAMLSDRASFDEMQAGSEAQHPDSARRHSEPSLGRIMPMPDAQAFESPSLVDKNEARRNSRGQAPPCPDTPLRKTPNGKTRDLIESQVLFAGPDFDPDAKDTAAAPHAEQFEFMGLLGAGAFGEVFKARCLISGDSYAIKKTKKQFRSEHDRDHALEEVRTVMAIGEHQNIVQCLGAWQADGHLFVQMEYCSLGNLKNYASHLKELMAEELWCILHDCSEGLRHIHDKDFLHLDLKPENIFLTETGLLKIGDFGVVRCPSAASLLLRPPCRSNSLHSCCVANLTRYGLCSGAQTVHQGCFEDGNEGDSVYLAPEVLDGDIGPAADIFSLGIMLFELAGQVELPANGGLWLSLRQRCR